MKLNALQVKNAKSKDKPYKLTDGNGLYLLVNNNGGKYWRYNYSYNKKQKTYSIGIYPDLSLSEAREELLKARNSLAKGIDPSIEKKNKKIAKLAQDSFKSVANEFRQLYRSLHQ